MKIYKNKEDEGRDRVRIGKIKPGNNYIKDERGEWQSYKDEKKRNSHPAFKIKDV